jgi:CysZ protein
MNDLLQALLRAFTSLLNSKIWWRILLPIMVTMALVFGIVSLSWGSWYSQVQEVLHRGSLVHWLAWPFLGFWTQAPVVLSQILAVVILIVTIVILSYLFCLILLSTLLVPLLLPLVVDQNYPGLLKGGKASFSGCLVNAGLSFLKYSLGLVLTLPLWLLPGMAFFLTAFWNGYLAGQVFPVDVLDGWATVEEQREIRADKRVGHFSLGLITSMLFFVPVINLCAPALMALAFIHYDFQALSNLRKRSLGPAQ